MKHLFLLFLFPLMLFAQDQTKLDSLNGLLKSAEHDTTRAKLLKKIGIVYYYVGEYKTTLDYWTKSLNLYEKLGDNRGIALCQNNIALIYADQGNYEQAIEYYSKSLKIREDIGFKKGIANSLNNIGLIYKNQGNYEQALDYFSKSLKISEELDDKRGIANSLNNIGIIYMEQGNYKQALDYYSKSLKIKEELDDKRGIANSLNNIGNIYGEQGNYKQALDYYSKSLKIKEELDDKRLIASSLYNIGKVYYKQNKIEKAIIYGEKGLAIAQDLGFVGNTKTNSELLFKAYEKSGNYKKSLEMHKLFVEMRDSMQNIEAQKKGFNHAMELKEKDHQNVIVQKELQAKYSYIIGGLVILVLITVALFIYRNYRIKSKSNQQIAEKNEQLESINAILDEKNHDIMSNITYAKKIQDAILPSEESMKNVLPDSFTLYHPKDVVSGDFYWVYKDKQDVAYFTVGDCTGHGVSGAFMSIIGQTLLNELVVNKGITEVNEILMQMRGYIIHYLGQKGETGEARDGMDIALCKMDISQNKLSYAGAYNSLYRIRNGELTEYKGSRRPVGYFVGKGIPFDKEDVDVQKGDVLYIFSDGYADQFGGPKGKKFMFGKFKKLLLSIHDKEMSEQKAILDDTLKDWMKGYEQIDDICVMGVRV